MASIVAVVCDRFHLRFGVHFAVTIHDYFTPDMFIAAFNKKGHAKRGTPLKMDANPHPWKTGKAIKSRQDKGNGRAFVSLK